MKGRESKGGLGGAPSADLLVCFPSRAHLALMPKPICSPSRPNEPNKHHHLKKIKTRIGGGGGGPASPMMWAKSKQMGGPSEMSEPTSPKVTCAGQIKVRPRASGGCRNWQSVMEEIERIHNHQNNKKKKSNWSDALGFKKDVMSFLTCLRNVRFDFRCFGSFPEPDITSDEEDDEDHEEEDVVEDFVETEDQGSNTVFSKWFMVLQEGQKSSIIVDGINNNEKEVKQTSLDDGELDNAPAIPPPNALLLMRCRSAPAKSWLEERDGIAKAKETKDEDDHKEREMQDEKKEETLVITGVEDDEEENDKSNANAKKKKKRESLAIVMKYDTDFYKLSSDVAQETWIVGEFKDPFSRSRSWRRW